MLEVRDYPRIASDQRKGGSIVVCGETPFESGISGWILAGCWNSHTMCSVRRCRASVCAFRYVVTFIPAIPLPVATTRRSARYTRRGTSYLRCRMYLLGPTTPPTRDWREITERRMPREHHPCLTRPPYSPYQ